MADRDGTGNGAGTRRLRRHPAAWQLLLAGLVLTLGAGLLSPAAVQAQTTNTPATGSPKITGLWIVGREVGLTQGTIYDAEYPPTFPDHYTIQWVRVDADGTSNPVDITGAASPTYLLVAADAGKKVKVRVSFVDDSGNPEMLTSPAYPTSGTVAGAPVTIQAVEISGPGPDEMWTDGETVDVTVVLSQAVTVASRNASISVNPGHSDTLCSAWLLVPETDYPNRTLLYANTAVIHSGNGTNRPVYRCTVGGPATSRMTVGHQITISLVNDGRVLWRRHQDYTRESARHGLTGPSITDVTINAPASGGVWGVGDTVEVRYVFSGPVEVGGRTSVAVRQANTTGGGKALALPFARVENGNTIVFARRLDGSLWRYYNWLSTTTAFEVGANAIRLHKGFIAGTGSGGLADLSHRAYQGAAALGVPPCGALAGEFWCETLTVGEHSTGLISGYLPGSFGSLSNNIVSYGTDRPISWLYYHYTDSDVYIAFSTDFLELDNAGFSLHLGPRSYAFPADLRQTPKSFIFDAADPGWSAGDTVVVRLTGPGGGGGGGGGGSRSEAPEATFENLPPGHDGTNGFNVGLRFSGAPAGLTAADDAASVLEVTGGTVTGARSTSNEANAPWEVTVAPDGTGDVTITLPVRDCADANAVCIGGRALSEAAEATVPGMAMMAEFTRGPDAHDGAASFLLHLEFSHAPKGFSYRSVQGGLFDVEGGQIAKARRLERGKNLRWEVTVEPDGGEAVTLAARATTDCTAQHAACDADERKFAGGLSLTVPGPQTAQTPQTPQTLPVVSIAASSTPVTEGTAASFALTRTGDTAAALSVTLAVTESGAMLDGTPPATATFAAGSASAALSVATLDDEAAEDASTVTAALSADAAYTVDAASGSADVVVDDDDAPPDPIIATWTRVPEEHDGESKLAVQLNLDPPPVNFSYRAIAASIVSVEGGTINRVWRRVRGKSHRWGIDVTPTGNAPITLTVNGSTDCEAAHAACTAGGGMLEGGATVTILGPALFSVADAEVDEADGATLDFVVSLSRQRSESSTVSYATSDGTAHAGQDYTATNGTLTFAASETSKTVQVTVLDDPHNDGGETMTLTLSSPVGARLDDATATGTISNTDAMPQAWIARFGRTVADQVLEAVQGRMLAVRTPGAEVSLGGERLGLGPLFGARTDSASGDGLPGSGLPGSGASADGAPDADGGLAGWLRGGTDPGSWSGAGGAGQAGTAQAMAGRDLLLGSSFSMTAGTPDEGLVSFWGRGAVTRFDGREGALTLDGEVTSADWHQERWTTGLAVAHSLGEGGYRGGEVAGTVESTLTGLYPWLRNALSERVEAWGVAGYGEGSLTLTPKGQAAIRTDMDLWMAAAGLRGTLIEGGGEGLTLTAKTDAMIVGTSTDAVSGSGGRLAAADAEVTRLRLGLEGTLPVRLADGSVLTPGFEIGVRHDGGDAETGFGADIGAGLAWSDPQRGLAAELRGRGLLTHEASGFRERGLSGAFSWEPVAGGRGPRLSLTQTLGGSSSGGADALLGRGTLDGLAANDPGGNDDLKARRLEARFGYGFAAFGNRFTLTPEAGLGLSNADRDYSLGWRLVRGGADGRSLELSFEARRRESVNPGSGAGAGSDPQHEAGLRLTARW